MHSVAKGKQWFHCCAEGFAYGMRCHIGVDAASGLVLSVESTAANKHQLNIAADRLHGYERLIYGDAGHFGNRCAEAVGYEQGNGFRHCQAEFRIVLRLEVGFLSIHRGKRSD
jgi:IS5 family transposase